MKRMSGEKQGYWGRRDNSENWREIKYRGNEMKGVKGKGGEREVRGRKYMEKEM